MPALEIPVKLEGIPQTIFDKKDDLAAIYDKQ